MSPSLRGQSRDFILGGLSLRDLYVDSVDPLCIEAQEEVENIPEGGSTAGQSMPGRGPFSSGMRHRGLQGQSRADSQ